MSLIMKIVLCQIRSEIEASSRSLGQFQSFSLVLSCAVWQCYAFYIWMYYWFSPCIRMSSEKVCSDLPDLVSPTTRFVNMTFVMKIVYRGWLHQPMEEERYHTHAYLLSYRYIQQKMYSNPLLVMSDSFYLFIDFHNENALSSLW